MIPEGLPTEQRERERKQIQSVCIVFFPKDNFQTIVLSYYQICRVSIFELVFYDLQHQIPRLSQAEQLLRASLHLLRAIKKYVIFRRLFES